MCKYITINKIIPLALSKPTYILTAGGIGVGKTYTVNKYINNNDIKIVDLDDAMLLLGHTDYTVENISEAMKYVTIQVEQIMHLRQSMVAAGTASDLVFSIDRLYGAKTKGYQTILLHIDAPIDQAIIQNKQRVDNGLHGVAPRHKHKIKKTNRDSARTVSILKDTTLVDYFVYHSNFRTIE